MGVVEVAGAVVFIVWVQRRIDGAANSCLSLCVRGGDLDFLQAEYVGPFPSLEVCAE